MAWTDDLWNEVAGDAAASLDWLKQVVFGEFDDHQSTSALITQLLVSFVPGAVIVMSARDLTAVLIRMVRHPDKRESVTEWMILVACAIGLVPALVGAVAGAAAAGVGAIVGGLAGDEAGAALRATALLLIEDGARLLEKLVEFLRRFIKGDIMRFLRAVKFAEYAEPVAKEVTQFIGHLTSIIEKVIAKASSFKWIGRVGDLIEKLKVVETGLRDLDRMAARQVKSVMGEFDKRLARALGEKMVQADHVVHPEIPAPHPTPKPPEPKRVAARADHPLGKAPGLEPVDPLPPKTPPDKNLHPQGVEETPSAAKNATDWHDLKAQNADDVDNWKTNFTTNGVSKDDADAYLASPDGQAYLANAKAGAKPGTDDAFIYKKAEEQVMAGGTLPTPADPQTLYKAVPTGDGVTPTSPYYLTKDQLNQGITSGNDFGSAAGLPLKTHADSYDIFQVNPTSSAAPIYQSPIAPTSELNGAYTTNSNLTQTLLTNKSGWTDPVKIGTFSGKGGSPID